MGSMERCKGARGELELVGLLHDALGVNAQRRCRQHEGDSDLVGIDGWTVECKRRKAAARADLMAWWAQTVEQARANDELPVLFVRVDRTPWRVIWPLAVLLDVRPRDGWFDFDLTVESSIAAWAAVAREHAAASLMAAEAETWLMP
ncbi:Holliday junction resolvase [Paraburkholderia sp. GAS448]|uniref:putative PDDEXK endonuclease n=1 Tax=Paraburkholderia sp. GAS448 TaxID=3035136 RepID=UPI003D24CC62